MASKFSFQVGLRVLTVSLEGIGKGEAYFFLVSDLNTLVPLRLKQT